MRKLHKTLIGFIVFFLILVQTVSAGTKLVSVIKGVSKADDPAVLAEALVIKRNGLDIPPKIKMKLNIGDEVITKQGINAVLEGGCYKTTISEKTCVIVKEDTFEHKWGNALNLTKTDSSCRNPVEIGGAKLLPTGTLFYIEEKSDIISSNEITPNVIVLDGEVKLIFNNGKQPPETLPVYTGYINGKVLGKGITTGNEFNSSSAYSYGRGGSMLGRNISVPQLSSYSSSDPIAEKIAKIENWFGYVVLASNYDFGEAGVKYAKKAQSSKIGTIASAKDYRSSTVRSPGWAGNAQANDMAKAEERTLHSPALTIAGSSKGIVTKISIASILIGEAASKPQSAIVRSKNGQPKSAFRNMKLKDGDQIMTRDASVILEADNGKVFYLLRNQTHVQLKQGRLYLVSGNAYYSDSVNAKIYAAEQWINIK